MAHAAPPPVGPPRPGGQGRGGADRRPEPPAPNAPTRLWVRVAVVTTVMWLAAAGATLLTRDPVLVPTVIVLGCFAVPTMLLFWLLDLIGWGDPRLPWRGQLRPRRLLLAFALGGGAGVWASAVLEFVVARYVPVPYALAVAVVEESVKLGLVWIAALGLTVFSRRVGMVLGAAVGLGFSAMESAGYSFAAVIDNPRAAPLDVLGDELERAILTPVGHALWTALLGGALFAAASRTGRLRLTWSVAGWLALVSGLHALWDVSDSVARWLASEAAGVSVSLRLPAPSHPAALHGAAAWWYHLFDAAFLVAIAGVGLALLRWQWRAEAGQSRATTLTT